MRKNLPNFFLLFLKEFRKCVRIKNLGYKKDIKTKLKNKKLYIKYNFQF